MVRNNIDATMDTIPSIDFLFEEDSISLANIACSVQQSNKKDK